MMDIVAVGQYYSVVADGSPAPDLRDELRQRCRERFRRIDRYTQLCLLGSTRCANGLELDENTGIYIGSRFASINSTLLAHEQMILKQQVLKPANFINTLSNSAGYFVAKNLNLDGKNIFVSRGDASTEAALQTAQLDIQCKQVSQALVGLVDEMGTPVQQHRTRLGIGENVPVAECSYWFLVEPSKPIRSLATICELQTLPDAQSLMAWLALIRNSRSESYLFANGEAGNSLTARDEMDRPTTLLAEEAGFKIFHPSPALGYHPSLNAGVMLQFINKNKHADLVTVFGDADQRFHVVHLRVER